MNEFRRLEKVKNQAKLEVITSILDDVNNYDFSKKMIIAMIEGYKTGLTAAVKFYEDKEIEDKNGAPVN